MTPDREYDRAVLALEETSGQLRRLNSKVDAIEQYGRVNRRRIGMNLALVVFDILLSIGTVVGVSIALGARDNARSVHAFEVQFCQSSNISRSQTNGLFDFLFNELIFDAPKISHEAWVTKLPTPAARQTVAGIYYRTAKTYQARNCDTAK